MHTNQGLQDSSANKNDALVSFMKKQIGEKSTKKSAHQQIKPNENTADENVEESEEEKALKEAKKNSAYKASQYNQNAVLKKMLLETFFQYLLLIFALTIFAIAVIHSGPAFIKLLNKMLADLFLSGFR